MKNIIILFTMTFLSVSTASLGRAVETAPQENLSSLISFALANNPEIKASAARWQMFTNRIAMARSFEDPMLMLKIQNGVVNEPFNFRKEAMTSKVIGISQQIPYWGKRELREDIAKMDAESYRWTVEERKLELIRMVKETWYQLFYIDKSVAVIDKNIKILDDFVTLAETRYSVSQGTQTDIIKAQVQRSRMLDMRITLEQQRKSTQANLNTLLFQSPEKPVGKIADFDITPLTLAAGDLQQIAYDNRPMFKSLAALVSKGESGLKLADKEFYPDFNVSLEYMQRDPAMGNEGLDMYSLGVTFNLPVQRERRHAAVAESNAGIAMATEELNSLKNSINFGVSDQLAQLERRRKLVELYKGGIILQAEQSLESAVINYRVNKVDFLTLLDSQMTLFSYERELYESQAEYMMQLARLEALVGVELAGK